MTRPTSPLAEPDADPGASWPPPIGATVVSPAGVKYEVVGAGQTDRLGPYVVLRHWQTFPVTRTLWFARAYRVEGLLETMQRDDR